MVDSLTMDKPDRFSRVWVLLASFATQAVVGIFDYATGYELNLDVLYFIPVSICAWYLRRSEVVVAAILGGLTWGYADIHAGHQYTNQAYLYCNIFVSFSSLIILGLVVKSLRDNLRKQVIARRELEKTLAELRQSGIEIEKLQSQLQVICAWTKRIKIEDRWMTFDQFLQEHLHVKISHGISPEALSELTKKIEGTKQPPES
jgi:K+-sensing histidine kinase KdpD